MRSRKVEQSIGEFPYVFEQIPTWSRNESTNSLLVQKLLFPFEQRIDGSIHIKYPVRLNNTTNYFRCLKYYSNIIRNCKIKINAMGVTLVRNRHSVRQKESITFSYGLRVASQSCYHYLAEGDAVDTIYD